MNSTLQYISNTPADTAYTLFLTAPAGVDILVPAMYVANQDGSNAAAASIAIAPTGTTGTAAYDIVKADSVAAGVSETMLVGANLVVPAGYALWVKSSGAADLTFTAVVKKASAGHVL